MLWTLLVVLAATPPAQAGVVVLGEGVKLYAHANDTAPVLMVGSGRHLALSVVSQADGWLQVSTKPTAPVACEPMRSPMASADLRLWVRAEDREQVLARTVRIPWPDGGRVVFHAGYRRADLSEAVKAPAWTALLDSLEAQIPADAWGLEATPETDPFEGEQAWRMGGALTWDRVVVTPSGPMQLPPAPWEPIGTSGELIRITPGCLTLVAHAPVLTAAAPQLGGTMIGSGGLGSRRAAPEKIRAGATLRWPDGSAAGTALAPIALNEVRAVGQLRCGLPGVIGHLPELCAAAADVVPATTTATTTP